MVAMEDGGDGGDFGPAQGDDPECFEELFAPPGAAEEEEAEAKTPVGKSSGGLPSPDSKAAEAKTPVGKSSGGKAAEPKTPVGKSSGGETTPGSQGKKQISLCKMFGVTPKADKATAADRLQEMASAGKKVTQLVVETADGTAELKRGGSFDRFGNKRVNDGGRPREEAERKRGVEGASAASNRRQAGEAPRRFELSAPEMYIMAVKMRESLEDYGDDDDEVTRYWKDMRKEWPDVSRDRLTKIKDGEKEWLQRCKDLNLSYWGANVDDQEKHGAGKNTGARATKPRATPVDQIIMLTKIWHEAERRKGHDVDRTEIFNDFMDRCEFAYKMMERRGERLGEAWVEEEKVWAKEVKEKFESLSKATKDAVKGFTTRLLQKMHAKVRAPSRVSPLTLQEEKVRCEVTWKQFDFCCWLAAFADLKELSKWVANPEEFILHRKDTWLIFSDQIPFWVKIGKQKTVLAEFELQKPDSKGVRKRKLAAAGGGGKQAEQTSQRLEDDEEEVEPDAKRAKLDHGGMTQSRGRSGGEKFRITFEARQAVESYFDIEVDPVDHVLPSCLILKGQYARLDNIDDNHRFIRDEIFWIGEKQVRRIS